MRTGLLLLAVFVAVAAGVWWFVGRGGADEPPTAPGGAGGGGGYRVVPRDTSWGAIEGTVRLARDIGVPVLRRKPGGCETDVSWTERASDILVYRPETGTLEGCVVHVRKIGAGKDWPEALRTAQRTITLTLRDGLLVPHFAWTRTDTGLRLVSEMPRSQANLSGLLGSVRRGEAAGVLFNVMLSPLATLPPNDDTTLRRTGVLTVTGDAACFPWLLAHVFVSEHPYVAGPTSHDGVYVLDDVPPGDYEVTCWHGPLTLVIRKGLDRPEYVYGPSVQTTQAVKVEPGRRTRLDFVLDAPR